MFLYFREIILRRIVLNNLIKRLTVKHLAIIYTLLAGLVACSSSEPKPLQFAPVGEPLPEIGIYEHLDEYVPDSLVFYNEKQEAIDLKKWIDKPTVLAFVYFQCPGLCSPLMDGMVDVVKKSDMKLGDEYQVATISFDYTDKPERAARKKENFTGRIKLGDRAKHWQYLTADSATIARITDAVGFKYKREGNDFVHTAALIMVSPTGKITRYLHGTKFLPFDLKMAAIEASEERSQPTVSKLLQYCFSYDPEGQSYVLNITKVSGSIIVFFALSLLLFLVFAKPMRRRRGVLDGSQA